MNVESQVSDEKNYEIVSTKVYDKAGNDVSDRYTINLGDVMLNDIAEDLRVVVQLQAKKQAGTVVIPQNDLLRLTTSKSGEGEISESKILKRGDSETVEWQAMDGWAVSEVIVDGEKIYYRENDNELIRSYSLRVEENGNMPFDEIEENHSVHITFEKIDEERETDTYTVTTSLVGDGVGTITSGNQALEAGEDYPIQWETEKNHTIVEVWVNGELREDLKEMNSFNIENIDQDYEVIVVVKRVINIDTDGDGKPDINIDTDDDGKPDVNVDTDDDGKPDINVDTDNDGKPDINVDTDNDGKPDINVDTDNDGKPDINVDTDNDGKPDINVDTDNDGKPNINVDTDNDGKPDINVDTDNDGKPDINVDIDNDGKPDINVDTDNDGKPDINVDTDNDGKPNINIDTDNDGKADINVDTDGDGKADINIDTDGDGKPNLNLDMDNDGVADTNIDTDGDGIADKNILDLNTSDDANILGYVTSMVLSFGIMLLVLRKRYRYM